MTKENFTSINVIIDRSGSMLGLAADTIGSFNTFLTEQKAVPGEAAFTLCTFNTDYQLLHDFIKLETVPDLDAKAYRPSGGTALLDAVGTTIDSVGQKLAAMPESDRPSKVIFLIITDGEENSSRRYTKEKIKAMVELQRNTYQWEFVFMGANIDAFSVGQSLGIAGNNSVTYEATKGGTHQLYGSVSNSMKSYRSSNAQQVDFFNQNPTVPVTPVVTTTTTTITTPPVTKK
jgi:hypothetical protein